ncbi:MAG: TRL-like family protein [Candidatus Spyradosoma sp.]
MKKSVLIVLASAAALFAGCAQTQPYGVLYTKVALPVTATDNSGDISRLKVGTAKCKSILNLVTEGDASVAAAMKNGNIKKVHSVDWKAESILGIISEYECVVYGE